jgi:hypothetical protein
MRPLAADLTFSSRYLTTVIADCLPEMRATLVYGRGVMPSDCGKFVRTFPPRDRGSLAATMRPLPEPR